MKTAGIKRSLALSPIHRLLPGPKATCLLAHILSAGTLLSAGLANGDFEQDLSVGWTVSVSGGSAYRAASTCGSGQGLVLARSYTSDYASVSQTCDADANMKVSFRALLLGEDRWIYGWGRSYMEFVFQDAGGAELARLGWFSRVGSNPGNSSTVRSYVVPNDSCNYYEFIIGQKLASDLPGVNASLIRKVMVHVQVDGYSLAGNGTAYVDDIIIGDTTSPALSITSHTNGQVVTISTITLAGTATDSGRGDNGISSVTVNGVRANNDTASASATASWNRPLTLTQRANTITVIAKDNSSALNATTQSITISFEIPMLSDTFEDGNYSSGPRWTVPSGYGWTVTSETGQHGSYCLKKTEPSSTGFPYERFRLSTTNFTPWVLTGTPSCWIKTGELDYGGLYRLEDTATGRFIDFLDNSQDSEYPGSTGYWRAYYFDGTSEVVKILYAQPVNQWTKLQYDVSGTVVTFRMINTSGTTLAATNINIGTPLVVRKVTLQWNHRPCYWDDVTYGKVGPSTPVLTPVLQDRLKSSYVLGETITLRIRADYASPTYTGPVLGAGCYTTLIDSAGKAIQATLTDQGTGADLARNDGIYSTLLPLVNLTPGTAQLRTLLVASPEGQALQAWITNQISIAGAASDFFILRSTQPTNETTVLSGQAFQVAGTLQLKSGSNLPPDAELTLDLVQQADSAVVQRLVLHPTQTNFTSTLLATNAGPHTIRGLARAASQPGIVNGTFQTPIMSTAAAGPPSLSFNLPQNGQTYYYFLGQPIRTFDVYVNLAPPTGYQGPMDEDVWVSVYIDGASEGSGSMKLNSGNTGWYWQKSFFYQRDADPHIVVNVTSPHFANAQGTCDIHVRNGGGDTPLVYNFVRPCFDTTPGNQSDSLFDNLFRAQSHAGNLAETVIANKEEVLKAQTDTIVDSFFFMVGLDWSAYNSYYGKAVLKPEISFMPKALMDSPNAYELTSRAYLHAPSAILNDFETLWQTHTVPATLRNYLISPFAAKLITHYGEDAILKPAGKQLTAESLKYLFENMTAQQLQGVFSEEHSEMRVETGRLLLVWNDKTFASQMKTTYATANRDQLLAFLKNRQRTMRVYQIATTEYLETDVNKAVQDFERDKALSEALEQAGLVLFAASFVAPGVSDAAGATVTGLALGVEAGSAISAAARWGASQSAIMAALKAHDRQVAVYEALAQNTDDSIRAVMKYLSTQTVPPEPVAGVDYTISWSGWKQWTDQAYWQRQDVTQQDTDSMSRLAFRNRVWGEFVVTDITQPAYWSVIATWENANGQKFVGEASLETGSTSIGSGQTAKAFLNIPLGYFGGEVNATPSDGSLVHFYFLMRPEGGEATQVAYENQILFRRIDAQEQNVPILPKSPGPADGPSPDTVTGTNSLDSPLTAILTAAPGSPTYHAAIQVRNPFEFPVVVEIMQWLDPSMSNLTVSDAVVTSSNLVWRISLESGHVAAPDYSFDIALPIGTPYAPSNALASFAAAQCSSNLALTAAYRPQAVPSPLLVAASAPLLVTSWTGAVVTCSLRNLNSASRAVDLAFHATITNEPPFWVSNQTLTLPASTSAVLQASIPVTPPALRVTWTATATLGTNLIMGQTSEIALDSDNDLLADDIELAVGTNPFLADTDGDGVPDGTEVFLGMDPTQNEGALDSDGDGATDLQEAIAGTGIYDPSSFPRLSAAPAGPGAVSLAWEGADGREYSIEQSSTLTPASWTNAASWFPGSFGQMQTNLPANSAATTFFRLKVRLAQ
jgi:hypothetical protein